MVTVKIEVNINGVEINYTKQFPGYFGEEGYDIAKSELIRGNSVVMTFLRAHILEGKVNPDAEYRGKPIRDNPQA